MRACSLPPPLRMVSYRHKLISDFGWIARKDGISRKGQGGQGGLFNHLGKGGLRKADTLKGSKVTNMIARVSNPKRYLSEYLMVGEKRYTVAT